jgi:hypothetical protein
MKVPSGRICRGVALAAALLCATPAHAQRQGDGFLFKPPSGAATFRGGFDRASAGSDIFSFTSDRLTLGRGDFSAVTFAADFTYRLRSRVDVVVFSVSSSRAIKASEFRNFVDNNREPILQTTTFLRVPLTASVKAYLAQPGRSVGHFAWVPARLAPYVGVGGGAMWYRFGQQGDFIDFDTTRVFSDTFDSSGWTPTVQGFAGADISLGPRFALALEAKYQWAKARLGSDFSSFDRIDLSGVSVTTGISIRY